jgi:hypothetical protein
MLASMSVPGGGDEAVSAGEAVSAQINRIARLQSQKQLHAAALEAFAFPHKR